MTGAGDSPRTAALMGGGCGLEYRQVLGVVLDVIACEEQMAPSKPRRNTYLVLTVMCSNLITVRVATYDLRNVSFPISNLQLTVGCLCRQDLQYVRIARARRFARHYGARTFLPYPSARSFGERGLPRQVRLSLSSPGYALPLRCMLLLR